MIYSPVAYSKPILQATERPMFISFLRQIKWMLSYGLMAPFAISILLSGVQSSTRMHSKLYADPMPSWGGHRFYASFNIGFNLIYRDDNADVNSLVFFSLSNLLHRLFLNIFFVWKIEEYFVKYSLYMDGCYPPRYKRVHCYLFVLSGSSSFFPIFSANIVYFCEISKF